MATDDGRGRGDSSAALRARIAELREFKKYATRADRVRTTAETVLAWWAASGVGLAGLVVVDAVCVRFGTRTEIIPRWALVIAASGVVAAILTRFIWRPVVRTLRMLASDASRIRRRRWFVTAVIVACYGMFGGRWWMYWNFMIALYAAGCYGVFMLLLAVHGKRRFESDGRDTTSS